MDTALRRTWRSVDTIPLMPLKSERTTEPDKAVQINLPRVFIATPSAGRRPRGLSCTLKASIVILQQTQVGWHNRTKSGSPQCQNQDIGGLWVDVARGRGDRDHACFGGNNSSMRIC